MTRSCILLFAALMAPAAAAQLDPVDILERMEEVRQQRIANVQNYTYIEKSSTAGPTLSSVQYYERATDEDGNPVAAFRMVPPNELANREAVAQGGPTAEQGAEGLADALGIVAGVLGGAAVRAGIDVPTEATDAVYEADQALRGIAAGSDMDTNADALESLEHMETLREHATSARRITHEGRDAYLIEANDLEDIEDLELSMAPPEGVTGFKMQSIKMVIDEEMLVPLVLTIEVQGETENGQTFPLRIEREDWRYQQFSDLYEATCTRGSLTFGNREQTAVMMRRYVELNNGPPSQVKQAELFTEAMDDFENYNCN